MDNDGGSGGIADYLRVLLEELEDLENDNQGNWKPQEIEEFFSLWEHEVSAEMMEQEEKEGEKEKSVFTTTSSTVTAEEEEGKVLFQNCRARVWKEDAVTAKFGLGQSAAGSTPQHQITPTLPTQAHSSLGAPPVSHWYNANPPQLAPGPPSSTTSSTQMAPSHSSLSSPGPSREKDTGQQQLSSQGGLVVYPPHPMHNRPPLLPPPLLPPPFTTTNNSANPTPPLLNTPPFFLDGLVGGSTWVHDEMAKTHRYCTLRTIDHSTGGPGVNQYRPQVLRFPFPPGSYPLPPERKKRPWTRFSADQLQQLEATFQEDRFPKTAKKKAIAASFGVTPKIISDWFGNRRTRWKKQNALKAKAGQGQSAAGSTPQHQISPTLPTQAHSSLGAPPVSHWYNANPPQLAPGPPSSTTSSTQMAPSHSSLSSPGQSRENDTGQQQLSSQRGLGAFPPHPIPNPPSLLQENLPPFTTTTNSANPTPPLLNTPPFFLDGLAGGSTWVHDEIQSLPTDTSSLSDLDYLMSSQQNSTYQLQTSNPTNQPHLQSATSLPSMPYLTPSRYLTPSPHLTTCHYPPPCPYLPPSPYLTPNPPDLNPASYLTLDP